MKEKMTLCMLGIIDLSFPLVKTVETIFLVVFHFTPFMTVSMLTKQRFDFSLNSNGRRSAKWSKSLINTFKKSY